jgi:hypothetical protein
MVMGKILPGGIARLTILTKQATSRVTTVMRPDGQRDQTARESLKEVLRFHYSTLIDDSNNRERQETYAGAERTGQTGTWPGM